MPLLARNAIAFLIAVAIYAGGLLAVGYIFDFLHLPWGLEVVLFFHCAFGIVGYFLFRGNSRAVLVLFASIIGAVALNGGVAPDPGVVADRRDGSVSMFVAISFGILAAMATNLTGWIVDQVRGSRSGPKIDEAKETESRSKRESTLVYRLGKWVGRRLRSSEREN